MLNLEYARLVDLDRRRLAEARAEQERALRDAEASRADEVRAASRVTDRAVAPADCRRLPGPA